MCECKQNQCACECDKPRKNTPAEMLEIITAVNANKPIEGRSICNKSLTKYSSAFTGVEFYGHFNDCQYRVKREPKVRYIVYTRADAYYGSCSTEEAATHLYSNTLRDGGRIVKMIES